MRRLLQSAPKRRKRGFRSKSALGSVISAPVPEEANQPTSTCPDPPYVRVILHPRLSGLKSPQQWESSQHADLTFARWRCLWRKLRPVVYDVDSAHVMFRVAGRLLPYAFGIVLFVGLAFLPRFLGMIYAVVTSVLFGMGVRYWVGHVRKTQLLALQTICQAQETSVFRKQGFALECDFVFNVGGRLPFAFCLYIIPFSQRYNASASTNGKSPTKNTGVLSSLSEYGNGYRRIELYNDGLKNIVKESSFDPISYTAGPSSPTLYSPISSESQDDGFWSQFWLDMSRAADAKRFAFRLSFVVACLLGGVLVIITGVVLFDAPVPESIALPFVICATFFSIIVCIICTCMLQSAVNVERRLVNLYAAAVLRRNGLHMEHRSIYGFGDTGGLFHIHYLYIFPIVDRHDSATLFVESN